MKFEIEWFDSGAGDPYFNMALDEVLFQEGRPTIRFYGWKERAYSIGYFQKVKDLKLDAPFVRRLTGGGTVEHGKDLTFSLVLDLQQFSFPDTVKESYSWIHQGISEGLKDLGVLTQVHSALDEDHGQFCFKSPTYGDLISDGIKVVGGAQRRRRQILLHQGSLRMDKLSVTRSRLVNALLEGMAKALGLTRISHQISTASADSASSASSDLVGHAQHTVKYASHDLSRLPRIQSGLDTLVAKSDEKYGFRADESKDGRQFFEEKVDELSGKYQSREWTYKY